MSRFYVLILEGVTERYFFPELIRKNFGFTGLYSKHNNIFYNEKLDVYLVFTDPPIDFEKKGKFRLYSQKTYRDAGIFLRNTARTYCSHGNYSISCAVFHDFDGCENQETKYVQSCSKKIMQGIDRSGIKFDDECIFFVKKEIESWFIAGLTDQFPYFASNCDKKKLAKILNSKSDSISQPKKVLNDYFDESLKDAPMLYGHECGGHVDLDKAKKNSHSFNLFITSFKEKEIL